MADERTTPNTRFPALALALAAVLFLIGDAWLVAKQPLAKVDPDALPSAHTWTWWATQEYVSQKKAPDILVLGSSLCMNSLSKADADYLNRDLDYVHHHRSELMEALLGKTAGVANPLCFNFGLPGSVVSDDYMVARCLANGAHKPKVMILGISIRDMMDNSVHCIGTTPPFKYLKRFGNIDDLLDLAMPQIFERSDYLIGKAIYLWGKKLDMQVVLAEQTKKLLSPVYSKWFADSRLAEADPEKNQPSNLGAQVEEHVYVMKAHEPYSYEDASSAYRKRYRSPNWKMFNAQKQFLMKLCELAKERNIQLVLVNMPITEENHTLMPPGSYGAYYSALREASTKYNVPFLSLDGQPQFNVRDFSDSVHMNGTGGKKFVEALVSFFNQNQQVAAALHSADSSGSPELAVQPKHRGL